MPAAIINLPKLPLFNKGLVTQRNPLVTPVSQFATNIVQHHDAFIDGENTELSSNNTLTRRWGLSRYSTSAFAANEFPDNFYLFRNTTGTLRKMVGTLGNTQQVYQFDSTSLTPTGILTTALGTDHWSFQSSGDYLYAMQGLDQAYRWQPDHVVGGQSVFRMGIAAPVAAPVLQKTALGFNMQTSTFYPAVSTLLGNIIVQESSLGIEDYTIQINSDSTIQISWTYTNYPSSSTAPSTDTTQTTPAGTATAVQVYVDPPNGAAHVSFKVTAVSNSTDDIATALINNMSLVTTQYGVPNVTFRSNKGIVPSGAAGRSITLVLSPDAQVATDIAVGSALIFTDGTTSVNSIIKFPFVDKKDALSGSFQLQTYVDGSLTGTETLSGADYDAIAASVNTFSHNAYVEKDGDLWQLVIVGNLPSPSLPASNTMVIVGANTLSNGVGVLTPTTDFVNNYGVRALTSIQIGYVWRNPTTGHISTMSPPVTLEATDSQQFVQLNVPISNDPQASVPEIYATADGGNSFALAPQIVLGKFPLAGYWTFAYVTPDRFLNEQVLAPLNLANEPPPKGANGVVEHTGRLWAFVGNVLYYSGGPDTTNGLGTEAWPPANNFTFPGKIVKLLSTPYGLLVFLNDDVHIVEGTDKASYFPHIFAANFGISNPGAAVLDAQTVYAYTTAKQFQAFGPGTQKEIGLDIAPNLQADFDPLYTTVAVLRGRTTDNAVFISNGKTKMFRWTPTAQSQWSPVGTYASTSIGIISALEVAAGDIRLLVGASGLVSPTTNYIMQRDSTVRDDIGTPYAGFATIGSIQITDPSLPLISGIDNLVIQTTMAGNAPVLRIALNELDGTNLTVFNQIGVLRQIPDPPTGRYPSTTLRQLRYYVKDSIVPITERAQNVFIRIEFPATSTFDEVLGLYASDKVQ